MLVDHGLIAGLSGEMEEADETGGFLIRRTKVTRRRRRVPRRCNYPSNEQRGGALELGEVGSRRNSRSAQRGDKQLLAVKFFFKTVHSV